MTPRLRSILLPLAAIALAACAGGSSGSPDAGVDLPASAVDLAPVADLAVAADDLAVGADDLALGADDLALAPPSDLAQNQADLAPDDASPGDGAAADLRVSLALPGAQLVRSDNVSIEGDTAEGYVVYQDLVANTVAVVKHDGSGQAVVASASAADLLSGNTVFAWSHVWQSSQSGGLSVWTSALGSKSISASSSVGVAAASPNQQLLLYADNVGSTGRAGDIVLGKSDGTAIRRVATAISMGAPPSFDCPPFLGFAGDGVAVTATCVDGTSNPATIQLINTADGSVLKALTGFTNVVTISTDGTRVAAINVSGDLDVIDPTSGAITKIDTGVAEVWLFPDGKSVLYRTAANDLKQSAIASPAPLTLVAQQATEVLEISPSFGYVAYLTVVHNPQTLSGELWVVGTGAGGVPTLVSKNAALFGDAFTADDKNVIWNDMLALVTGSSDYVGELNVTAIATNTISWNVGQAEWLDFYLANGKIAVGDHYQRVNGRGYVDIESLDVSSGAAKKTLVAGPAVDETFVPSFDRRSVVYSYSGGTAGSAQNGIYVAPVP